jgi:hypothetical protein
MEKAFARPTQELAFIFFRQRNSHFDIFAKAIAQQNEREQNKRIVAVKGLHPDRMFQFETRLQELYPEIEAVYSTPSTFTPNPAKRPLGRYNLLCSKANFLPLAQKLSTDLAPLYMKFLAQEDDSFREGDEPVEMVSRLPGEGAWWKDSSDLSESSLSTRDSFTSGCVSLFQGCASPWGAEEDPGPPPTVYQHSVSPSTTDMSPITTATSPTYAQVAATKPPHHLDSIDEVQQLKSELQNLRSEMKEQLQRHQEQMLRMFQSILSQGFPTDVPIPAISPHRKKTRTSDHDGGSAEESADDSDTPMNDES